MKQEWKKPNVDRLLAVMRGQKADRVPNFEDIIIRLTAPTLQEVSKWVEEVRSLK